MQNKKDIFDHIQKREIPTPSQKYFDDLSAEVIAKNSKAVIPLYWKIIYISGAAAAVLLIGFFLIRNMNVQDENTVLAGLDELTKDEIFAYIDENLDDFDTDLILEVVDENDLETMEFTTQDETISATGESSVTVSEPIDFEGIDREDILKYLELEDIDPEELEDRFI